jgi:nitrite reductase/ring-hydroxylating ferredoxin subunit
MIFFPGEGDTASNNVFGGIVILLAGLGSGALMQVIAGPMMGMDPPLPIKAKSIIPHSKMKSWSSAGKLSEFRDGIPTEIRMLSIRVVIVRQGEEAHALAALCPHARLPLASFPGLPLKPDPISEECITCPFHGARFEAATGKVVRQPFTSEFNAEHPFLGRLQSKMFFFNKGAEDTQTYPVKIEGGEILVHLPR